MRTSQILIIDNRDSFTHNLAQIVRETDGYACTVIAHNNIPGVEISGFDKIIFSPGPGLPSEFPEMFEVLREHAGSIPILGVCLGQQAIAEFFGGRIYNLPRPNHGQRVAITIERKDVVFRDVPSGTYVGLYHSWAVDRASLPEEIEVTASGPDGVVMALRHRVLDVCGVQFHPESYMTEYGVRMVQNWLEG